MYFQIFVIHIWISVLINLSQHPNIKETGYSNVLGCNTFQNLRIEDIQLFHKLFIYQVDFCVLITIYEQRHIFSKSQPQSIKEQL